MMRRLVTILALAGALLVGSRAKAQEIQLTGPLAGAPATRHLREYRTGRFEIAPAMSFTLLDEYRRTIFIGAELQYNIAEWLSIGAYAGYGLINTQTDLTEKINANSPRSLLDAVNIPQCQPGAAVTSTTPTSGAFPTKSAACPTFGDQAAKLTYFINPQVQFVPFRGKLALFQKIFVDTDAYLHAGAAFVGVDERKACGGSGQALCSDPVYGFQTATRLAVAPTFGLGLKFYFAGFMSLGAEYKAFPFSWNRGGFDSRGNGPNQNFPDLKVNSDDRTFKFNQMVTVSLGFSLPPKPTISQ
jgi:outer membrane beta-barrel protein